MKKRYLALAIALSIAAANSYAVPSTTVAQACGPAGQASNNAVIVVNDNGNLIRKGANGSIYTSPVSAYGDISTSPHRSQSLNQFGLTNTKYLTFKFVIHKRLDTNATLANAAYPSGPSEIALTCGNAMGSSVGGSG